MIFRTLASIGVTSLLLSPVSAQFGVPQKKKGGTFEEMNQLAKDKMAGLDGANLMEELANMDPDEMMKIYKDAMNDPSTRQYMEQFGEGMAEVMEQFSKMDPETMKAQIQDNLSKLSSPDILDLVLESKDEVIDSLLDQGLLSHEQAEEYRNNPELFQKEMSASFEEMNKLLSDPDALNMAMDMMAGMGDVLSNPTEAMKKISDAFESELGDDDKIEEARLQLLADPKTAGNPALSALFENQDMKEILSDPIKFREQVKKGQEMIKGTATGGAKYGEL